MSGIGNVGGNQPINKNNNTGLKLQNVPNSQEQEIRSIFNRLNTDGNNVLNEQDGAGTVQKFWTAVNKFLNSLKNIGKSEQKGTAADVNGATNAPQNEDKTRTTFDKNGNVIPEVTDNPDGSRTIQHAGETIKASSNSIDVTDATGKSTGGIKLLNNGMYCLLGEDGKQGVFDPKKGEFLPDNEAQKILAQFS